MLDTKTLQSLRAARAKSYTMEPKLKPALQRRASVMGVGQRARAHSACARRGERQGAGRGGAAPGGPRAGRP